MAGDDDELALAAGADAGDELTESGTACRISTGSTSHSANAPWRPTIPSTVRFSQCAERPAAQAVQSWQTALISPTTRRPSSALGPRSTAPTNSWPGNPVNG